MSRSADTLVGYFAVAVAAMFAAVTPHASRAQTLADVRTACATDVQSLCAGVAPGGGRVLACLKQHQANVSDGCKQAIVQAMHGSQGGAQGNTGSGAATPPAPSQPAPDQPSSNLPTPNLPAPSNTAPLAPTSSAAKAASAASRGSYLLLKKAQLMMNYDPNSDVQSPAIEMLIPSAWKFKGTVNMYAKTGCFSEAFSVFWEATSDDGITKMQGVPNDSWQYSDDPQEMHNLTDVNRRTHTGNKTNDLCPVSRPISAEQYFRQKVLGGLTPQMTVVSIEPFPDLEQIVRQRYGPASSGPGNNAPRVEAIRARLAFQKDDKPMELWYSVALVTQSYRVGRGFLYDIHAVGQVALGAPKGQLDAHEKLFKVVLSSIQPTPRYTTFTNQWIAKYFQIQANKEAAMDKIQADLDNFITQTYMHMSANAQQASDRGFHATDQNLRDVQTYRDPSTGRTFELSNQYNHAWLNGSDQYVMSDDPSFNPNANLNGSWTQLQPVEP